LWPAGGRLRGHRHHQWTPLAGGRAHQGCAVIGLRTAFRRVPFAVLATAVLMASAPPASLPASLLASITTATPSGTHDPLADANRSLQAGEADKALALLGSLPSSGPSTGIDQALAHNLACRVRITLEQWDAAVN